MGKALKIFLIILAVIIVVIAIIIFLALRSFAATIAILNIESGKVEVNTGKGWRTASDGMELDVKDSVRTLDDGNAVIVLYESVTIQIEPNTEINLEKLAKDDISIKQDFGYTWSKFLGLVGVGTYSVTTPTTVATVRGTAFGVNSSKEATNVFVGEGKINLKDELGEMELDELRQLMKEKGRIAVISELSAEQRAIIKRHLIKDFALMKEIRLRQITKNKIIMMILKRYNISEEELPEYLEKIDKGEIELNKIIEKSPIKGEFLERVLKVNNRIIEHRKLLLERYNVTLSELGERAREGELSPLNQDMTESGED